MQSIPLPFAGTGRKLVVAEITGGCGVTRRLSDMGMVVGSQVMIVGGSYPGPLIIDVRGSRLALGCGIAHKIIVKEMSYEEGTDYGGERVAAGSPAAD